MRQRVYLASPKDFVTGQVKNVLDELWNCISPNPKEYSLSILNQEQTVSLQPLRAEWKKRWHDDAIFIDGSSLQVNRQIADSML